MFAWTLHEYGLRTLTMTLSIINQHVLPEKHLHGHLDERPLGSLERGLGSGCRFHVSEGGGWAACRVGLDEISQAFKCRGVTSHPPAACDCHELLPPPRVSMYLPGG